MDEMLAKTSLLPFTLLPKRNWEAFFDHNSDWTQNSQTCVMRYPMP